MDFEWSRYDTICLARCPGDSPYLSKAKVCESRRAVFPITAWTTRKGERHTIMIIILCDSLIYKSSSHPKINEFFRLSSIITNKTSSDRHQI